MTAKSNPGPRGQETVTSKPAEVEKDVVSEAKPVERKTAEGVADHIADLVGAASVAGNRLTLTFEGPNGLVQTFYATVEPGVSEF